MAIVDALDRVHGLSLDDKEAIAELVSNNVSESIGSTWEEMELSERAGPPLWSFLHWMGSVADNEDTPELYMDALDVVARGHPCKKVCRPHLLHNLETLNPYEYSSMFKHSVELHNLVNQQLHKSYYPLSKARKNYDLECDSCIFNTSPKRQIPGGDSHEFSSKTGNVKTPIAANNSHKKAPDSYAGAHKYGARNTHQQPLYNNSRGPPYYQ